MRLTYACHDKRFTHSIHSFTLPMQVITSPYRRACSSFGRAFSATRAGAFFESVQRPHDGRDSASRATTGCRTIKAVSKAGTLRGLHFQRPPHAQAKLVRVAQGRALDVVVDLRHRLPHLRPARAPWN